MRSIVRQPENKVYYMFYAIEVLFALSRGDAWVAQRRLKGSDSSKNCPAFSFVTFSDYMHVFVSQGLRPFPFLEQVKHIQKGKENGRRKEILHSTGRKAV